MPEITKQKPAAKKATEKVESVIDRIKPIGFGGDEGIKILLYGKSGTGKTTLWATFPPPILSIIVSGGNKPGELRSIDTPEYRDKIKAVSLKESSEFRELLDHIAESGRYNTVVLDHASGLQDLVLKEILGLEEIPAYKSWGLASQQQYGQCTQMCKEYLRGMLGLDCNVVIIAQEREFNNEASSELITPYVGAGLVPSLTGWLNTAVDYICQTFLRQKEGWKEGKIGGKPTKIKVALKGVDFCLRTAPDAIYTTKFRMPRGAEMPDMIVDPSYTKISRLIKGIKEAKAE